VETPLKEIELVCSLGFTRIVLYRIPGERYGESRILLSRCREFVVDIQWNGGTDETTTCAFRP